MKLTFKKKTEKVIENTDNALNEIPDPLKIELGDPLLDVLSTKANDIIQDDYVNDKVLNEKSIEDIKDEYNFEEIKDSFDDGSIPPQLEFSFGGDNDNFLNARNLIGLNEDNNKFVSLLCSDMGQNKLTSNSLSIHVENGNMFYDNFSTNKSVYNFLLAQQDKTKQFIPKCISYYHSFQKYMK